MPISIKHNLCFIHVPKTAGTTVQKSLGLNVDDAFYKRGKYKDYGVCPQHLTLTELSKEIDLSNFTIFSVVRNPFDRIVSEFEYHKECAMTRDYHHLTFPEFVDTCLKIEPLKRKYIFDGHLELQTDYICGEHPVKIFKYENLQECFDWLREITREDLKFGHERKSIRKDYRDYYTDVETIKTVEDFYRADLDYLDYTF